MGDWRREKKCSIANLMAFLEAANKVIRKILLHKKMFSNQPALWKQLVFLDT